MAKLNLQEQAEEILRIAEKYGVEQNFLFITTFKRYQVQLNILNDLEQTIKKDGSLVTKEYEISTIVSLNPIMVDGTGMCGACRVTVGGKVKFACVDGPDFDGFEVDFDEAISRSRSYLDFEENQREKACNLYNKEVR